jgi:hypothetical protein
MIDTTRNIIQAYVALANKTFQQEDNVETFDSLEDIATHLKSTNPPPDQEKSNYDNDSENQSTYKNKNIVTTEFHQHIPKKI